MRLAYNREMRKSPADAVPAGFSSDAEADANAEKRWGAEVRRRLQEIDSGAARLIPWPDARRRLRARLQR